MKTIALVAILATTLILSSCKESEQTSNSNSIVGVYTPVFEMLNIPTGGFPSDTARHLGDTSSTRYKVQIDANGIIRWMSMYIKDTSGRGNTGTYYAHKEEYGEAVILEMQAPNGFLDTIQYYLSYCDFYNMPDTLPDPPLGTKDFTGASGYIATFNTATPNSKPGTVSVQFVSHRVTFPNGIWLPDPKFNWSMGKISILFENMTYPFRIHKQ